MNVRTLPSSLSLKGKRILVRVDWNVPLRGMNADDSLKITRSLPTLRGLASRGAIVIVLTHLGRPTKHDPTLSVSHLLPILKAHGLNIDFHTADVSKAKEHRALEEALCEAKSGSIHLLENVRFQSGEEKNDVKLAKAYASLGEMFVNDAFASCHRAHVSVVGIAKQLPSFAGSTLADEIKALNKLLQKPKKPFVVMLGGLKLSTKLPVIQTLLKRADRILIGGAMATAFLAAEGQEVGQSAVDKESVPLAKKYLKEKKIGLPVDVIVTDKLGAKPKLRRVSVDAVGERDMIVDLGPKTLAAWAKEIRTAKTILWNGPVGLAEIPSCGAGSRFIARTVALRAKGAAFGVAGGGDTLPIILATKTAHWFDHVSTGGGALLEYLAENGELPGVKPLILKK